MPVNRVGRAYSRPTAGTAKRPEKNAFGTPHIGACFQRCLLIEIGRFAVDSMKLRNDHVIGVNYSTISASQSRGNSSLGPLNDVVFQ